MMLKPETSDEVSDSARTLAASVMRALRPHAQVSFTKVASNRGSPRLWLEGLRLNRCGFHPGVRFRVDLDLDRRQVRLRVDQAGERKVSQRQHTSGDGTIRCTPIIDVTGGALAEVLGEGARVRATLAVGEIVFDLHPVDLAIEARERRTREHIEQGYITEGTLCVGAGVSTLALKEGLETQGLEARVDWIVDRNHQYLEMAALNNPAISRETRLYEASLEEIEPGTLTGTDVLNLSLPCTGHSKSGKAKRQIVHAEEHPTDALAVYGALRILDAVNPSAVVSENVVDARNSASYIMFMAYLKAQGFELFEGIYDAEQAGTLENRRRWWLLGISKGLASGFSMDQVPNYPKQFATLGHALEAISDDDSRWKAYDYLIEKAKRDAAAGKNFKPNLVKPEDEHVGGISRGYARVRQTDPRLVRDDGLQRLFTPEEHARIKGIPEYLVRGFPASIAHEALGQSILYGHAKGIGEALAVQLLGLPNLGQCEPGRQLSGQSTAFAAMDLFETSTPRPR